MTRLRSGLLVAIVVLGAGCASEPAPIEDRQPGAAQLGNSGGAPTPAPLPSPGEVDAERSGQPRAATPDETFSSDPWPARPHGQRDATAGADGATRVRFEPPSQREPREPRSPLPARARLGLVVVRGGVLVQDGSVLLDLEARLDAAVDTVIALRPGPGARDAIGLDGLAALGRDAGLDLVLVDVQASAGAAREGWLVTTSTRELVGAFVEPGETSPVRPPTGIALLAQIEQAWRGR